MDAPDPKIDDSGSSDDNKDDSVDGSHSESSDDRSGDDKSGDDKSDDDKSGSTEGGSGDGSSSHDGSGDSGSGENGSSDGGSDHSGDSGSSGGSGDSGSSGHDGGGDTSGSSDRSGSGDHHDDTRSSSSERSGSSLSTDGKSANSDRNHGSSRVESHLEIAESEHGERFVKGEVVVMSSRHDMASLISKHGLKIIETFNLASLGLNGYRVSVPSADDEQKVLDQLKKMDPKGVATLNHVYMPARGVPSAISGPASIPGMTAAKRTSARIGLVDARVDTKHPLLKSVRVASRVFGVANAVDDNHGTAVASRIAESAPGANLFVASVFSELSSGDEIASVDAIAKGLEWLSANKVPVINLSLTGPSNPILQAVTSRLVAKGFLLVAAVGNEGPHAPAQYPAAYDGVIGVTAVDDQNRVYLYANQGNYVDFAAPGVNTVVATSAGKTETASGTSFAAPVIAVALARMMPRPDKDLASKAEAELEKQAKDIGAPGRDSVFGYGVIEPTMVD